MDCRSLEERLDSYLGRTLSEEESALLDQHLGSCQECRRLVAAASGAMELRARDDQELVRSILVRTAGSPCLRCRELICEYVDEVLNPEDSELIRAHLNHCPQCAALAEGLANLRNDLPALAEIEPDPLFTAAVTRRLSAWRNRPADRSERLRQWWLNLVRRPRFSWEAAYVGTLLFVLAFANPLSLSYGSLRNIASPDSAPRAAWVRLTQKAPEVWDVCADRSAQTAADVAASVSRAVTSVQRFANQLVQQIACLHEYPARALREARLIWNEWQHR